METVIAIKEYFDDFTRVLNEFLDDEQNQKNLYDATNLLKQTKKDRTKIILIGNGGSSAIAEHMAVDLTKNAGLKALTISGSPMLTTLSNDYGFERVFEKGVEAYGQVGDVLIAISSSGASKNILNGCKAAKLQGMKIITLSGFDQNNPLRKCGDINFWINSKAFGYVELIHNLLLHYTNDAIIGKTEYIIR